MMHKNLFKTIELASLICGAALIVSCGMNDAGKSTSEASGGQSVKLSDIASQMESTQDESANESANQEEEKEEPVQIKESSIKEQEVPEAIVIDDNGSDLLALANGNEADYPANTIKENIPSVHISDLVDGKDYITPVRNQGHTALCWNYSALGAIESDLLIHYSDQFDVDTLNLSEKHGAYYNMHRAAGSYNGGIDDDYREFDFSKESDAWIDEYDTSYISVGGVTNYCLSLYTAWKGPVYDVDKDSFNSIKGQSAIYSDNDDKPSDAYESICHVQGVYEIPATKKNRDLIKLMIMEHGSVTGSVCADDGFWAQRKTTLYDYKKYDEGNVADHEILIIGWDDDYDESNFITRPDEKGAFICKNSWGTGYGSEGYFYISYADTVLSNNNVVAYDSVIPGDSRWYDGNYQYAGFLTHVRDAIVDRDNCVYMLDDNKKSYCIDITVRDKEELCAVGLFSMAVDMDYKIDVYNINDIEPGEYVEEGNENEKIDYFDIKKLGEPLISQDFHAITGGYHTFEFDQALEMNKGDELLIVVTPQNEEKLVFEKAMDYTDKTNYDEWQHNLGAIHTLNTCSMHCYFQDESGEYFIRQRDKDFFVKAYTKKK
ncbi:MAG: hypothetical protein E7302_07685 [Butyrivibrio sp.]|nr:hypothetical protein [Butyrivibrio sp.]